MQITIRLLASYRRCLPEGHDAQAGYPLEVPAGATVGKVLPLLPIPQNEICTYLINGRHAEHGEILEDGDILSVFPAVGGG
jgi:molybdopterin synthase sulfur carrier subunit